MLYTIAVTSIAIGIGFWYFWLSMVIMTFGELILEPIANAYAANLASPDKRGRYMSIFGMSLRIAIGLGPIYGGLLNNYIGSTAIWLDGTVAGLNSNILHLNLKRLESKANLSLDTRT